ncbi:ubiquitin-specific protease ubp2 [Orobanche minor]
MAKKVKKVRSGQKDKRGPSTSQKIVSEQSTSISQTPSSGVSVVTDRGLCSHIDKGINMDKLAAELRTSGPIRCEDCREHIVDSRSDKGRGKHGKKGGTNSKSESRAVWICLECGHFACGGLGLPTTPQSHAVRHARQNHHPLVVHYENHQLLWCFPCDKLVHAGKSEDSKHKIALKEVMKMLKQQQPAEGSNADVEDVWFGSASATSAVKMGYSKSIAPDIKVGYSVRGLVNLGNTCFFNSIMQNLLAIHSLREYLFELDESVGSLFGALRKFFLETSTAAGSKGVINPRSLFGSLCIKSPQFRGYQQHDSHELLRCLLDGLSTEELSARKHTESSDVSITDPTFVDAIFGGQLSSTVSCLECGHASTIYEPFLDLSLPVPTKKPSVRRIQPARGKKAKLLPKQSRRNLSKISREANNLQGESVSAESLSELQSIPHPWEQVAISSGDYALSDSADANAIALDMGFTVENLSSVQKLKIQQAAENAGDLAWLDYLDANPISGENDVDTGTDEISAIQVFANENVLQTMDSRDESNLATAFSVTSLDSTENFNALVPGALTQDQDASSPSADKQNEKPHSSEGLITREDVHSKIDVGHSSESCIQVFSNDPNALGRDNENPSQIQDAEIVLLPSKEDASSRVEVSKAEMEVSSSVPGDEQDSLDFVNLGDLFNEPEVLSPSDQPVPETNTKNGVIGNSSESDPDEVDNADAPVSVESCLALFAKPELLFKDEHAWQCDNCSKTLRERRFRLRSKPKLAISEDVANGVDGKPSGASDVGKMCSKIKSRYLDLKKNIVDPSEVIYENGECMLEKCPETDINASDSQWEKTRLQKFDSCLGLSGCSSPNNQDAKRHHGEGELDEDVFEESNLSAACESELTEQDEVHLGKLKVKRDAIKSILIRKAPPVLTIHLKRFSQEARGRLSKLNGHVRFKDTIDLKPYMDPRCSDGDTLTYRLVGVVEHLGSMRGGHYVAYVRGGGVYEDCVWYHASDAYVRQASLEEVLRCEAYILFYEKT